MEVIAVANQKGGSGKTTTSVNLSTYLAVLGKRTLLVDMDPQGSSTTHFGIDKWHLEKTLYDVLLGSLNLSDIIIPTGIAGLDLAPTNNRLARAELELVNKLARESVLKNKLQALQGYDFVIIDTPPTLSFLTLNALVACDTILIPIQTEFFALEGMTMLLELVEMISKELGHSMRRRYLLTMYDARTNLSKDVARKVKEHFQEEVFKTVIPQNIKLAEAPSYGKAIYSLAPESPGAEAYAQLAKEVIE